MATTDVMTITTGSEPPIVVPNHPGYASERLKHVARLILEMPYWERGQIGAGMALAMEKTDVASYGYSEAVCDTFKAYLGMVTAEH